MKKFRTQAKGLAALGRHGDTELLHVSKPELHALKGLGHLAGVHLSRNPHTHLPEAFNFLSLIPIALGAVATVLTEGAFAPAEAAMIGGEAAGTAATGAAAAGATGAAETGLTAAEVMPSVAGALTGAASGAAINAAQHKNAGLGALSGAASGLAGASLGSGISDIASAGADTGTATDAISSGAQQGMENAATKAITPSFDSGAIDAGQAAVEPGMGAIQGATNKLPTGLSSLDTGTMDIPTTALAHAAPTSDYSKLFSGEGLDSLGSTVTSPRFILPFMGGQMVDQYANQQASGNQARHSFLDQLHRDAARNQQDLNTLYSYAAGFADGGEIRGIPALSGGGYFNALSFPNQHYPQSMIPQAQMMPGATPQRHEVLGNFESGGFLQGDGDGMSDSIRGTINGQQPVRLADGEYVMDAHTVSALGNGSSRAGAKFLDGVRNDVRQASTGSPKQMRENAGQLAFQRAVERQQKRGQKRA